MAAQTDVLRANPALAAYEAMAPHYDCFTDGYAHAELARALHRRLRGLGLVGRDALDVACGTGKSTAPLTELGYRVSACDLSPQMVELARSRLGDAASLFVADMRTLPPVGPFDVAFCLDDAINYLLSDEDLKAAMCSIASVLRPGGLLVFDTNSLATYRGAFARDVISDAGDRLFCWRGQGSEQAAPGEAATATLEIFQRAGDRWSRATSVHHQRHHPMAALEAALTVAGLRSLATVGLVVGGRLTDRADETVHPKLVHFAAKAA
jgi:SAM-dependent methyltransferase